MQLQMLTYRDLIDHVIDYLGSATDSTTERFARRSVQMAMNAIWNDRNWVYFYQRGRINTVASYATGTIAYDATGGAVERQITLTGGTFPSWSGDGVIAINNIPYEIASRVSDTVLQMASRSDPHADIASTQYTIFKDTYTLPVDFGAMGEVVNVGYVRMMAYVPPDDFIKAQRMQIYPATPFLYTITGDPRRYGAMVIRFYQPPDAIYSMDFSYRRSPRQLNVIGYDTGKVSVTSGSATLTGSGTSWTSSMVGAILRVADPDTEGIPTGVSGANPALLERAVAAYVSATELTLDAVASSDITNASHSISDPVDIEPGAMLELLLRSVERQARQLRRMKATPDEERQYAEAKISAFEADARHYESRSTFSSGLSPTRMAMMPRGPDQS